MNTSTEQAISNTTTIRSEYPVITSDQTLYTVEQFAKTELAFTVSALRNLIFKSESRYTSRGKILSNGLVECGAIVRCGRKIMINRQCFLEWVQKK